MIALLLAAAVDLASTLKAVKQDGPVALPPEAQQEIVAMLPAPRKGEECPAPATVTPGAQGLKDRGDGPVVVVAVASCKGHRLFALSTGTPLRIARLADVAENETLRSLKALSLLGVGGKRERDMAVELQATATVTELRLFARRETGFGFTEGGTLRDYEGVRECSAGGEEGMGWSSYVRSEKDQLAVLRVDASCGGGAPWQASCLLFRAERDVLARAGVCALPGKLEAKALRASGWK